MKTTRCTVEGCNTLVGSHGARGMCPHHYQGMASRGEIDISPHLSPEQRLSAGLVEMPSGCLEWTKSVVIGGYGQIKVNGKSLKTHRFSWELAHGPIPEDMDVLHHCDNPPCCQTDPTAGYPDGHLFLGTAADNMADRDAKGRHGQSKKTHCKQGHPFDEANTYITPEGARNCRTCKVVARAKYNQKQRSAPRVEAA